VNERSLRLARSVLDRGYAAAVRRAASEVGALDAVLDRIGNGLTAGAERALADLMAVKSPLGQLQRWLSAQPQPRPCCTDFRIVAALLGDGKGN
jgi:hypothetical protein